MSEPPTLLPASYWWTGEGERQHLYLRYGCVAKVEQGKLTVGADGLWPELSGPCRSVAQGKRFVERIVAVRGALGTPDQQQRRRAMLHRRWRATQLRGTAGDPDGEDALRLP